MNDKAFSPEFLAKKAELMVILESYFPNDHFKHEAEACLHAMLPKPGSDGVTPALLVLSKAEETDNEHDYQIRWYSLVLDNFNDFDVRCDTLRKIGEDCAARKELVLAILFASEAWVSRQDPDAPRQYARAGDDPNRQEAAIIAGKTVDGRALYGTAELTRNRKQKIKSVGKVNMNYDLDRKGVMTATLLDEFYNCYMPTLLTTLRRHMH